MTTTNAPDLKAARIRKGLTLRELAEAVTKAGCPVGFSALSKIEKGERSPRPALAAALGKVLDFDPADL
jgi:transcriptional regulator with XRE-family HTH domain